MAVTYVAAGDSCQSSRQHADQDPQPSLAEELTCDQDGALWTGAAGKHAQVELSCL